MSCPICLTSYDKCPLHEQLAAERAKVAMAVEALGKRSHCKVSWNGQPGMMSCREVRNAVLNGSSKATKGWKEENRLHPERVLCADCQTAEVLETLQSSDALAKIRREVARECESVMLDCLLRMPRSERTTKFASAVADAIRAKFNLAP